MWWERPRLQGMACTPTKRSQPTSPVRGVACPLVKPALASCGHRAHCPVLVHVAQDPHKFGGCWQWGNSSLIRTLEARVSPGPRRVSGARPTSARSRAQTAGGRTETLKTPPHRGARGVPNGHTRTRTPGPASLSACLQPLPPLPSLLVSPNISLIAYQMDSYCIIKPSKPAPSPLGSCRPTYTR